MQFSTLSLEEKLNVWGHTKGLSHSKETRWDSRDWTPSPCFPLKTRLFMDWWILTAKSSRCLLKQRTTAPTSYLSDLHWWVKPFFFFRSWWMYQCNLQGHRLFTKFCSFSSMFCCCYLFKLCLSLHIVCHTHTHKHTYSIMYLCTWAFTHGNTHACEYTHIYTCIQTYKQIWQIYTRA